MRKKTKALSGASKDAYLRRVLDAHPELSPDTRKRLLGRLRQEVAQLRVRVEDPGEGREAASHGKAAGRRQPRVEPHAVRQEEPPSIVPPVFDPFSPNVIVVLRREGRNAALEALEGIDSVDNLLRLAQEQRLHIVGDAASPAELRLAIVAAAERRVANRLAAAS